MASKDYEQFMAAAKECMRIARADRGPNAQYNAGLAATYVALAQLEYTIDVSDDLGRRVQKVEARLERATAGAKMPDPFQEANDVPAGF